MRSDQFERWLSNGLSDGRVFDIYLRTTTGGVCRVVCGSLWERPCARRKADREIKPRKEGEGEEDDDVVGDVVVVVIDDNVGGDEDGEESFAHAPVFVEVLLRLFFFFVIVFVASHRSIIILVI